MLSMNGGAVSSQDQDCTDKWAEWTRDQQRAAWSRTTEFLAQYGAGDDRGGRGLPCLRSDLASTAASMLSMNGGAVSSQDQDCTDKWAEWTHQL
jgi:hypothetical protein